MGLDFTALNIHTKGCVVKVRAVMNRFLKVTVNCVALKVDYW
jgi:hypothetical protein